MDSNRIMTAPELSQHLDVSEVTLHELAHSHRLPLCFSGSGDWFIQRRDLGSWQSALSQHKDCCDGV